MTPEERKALVRVTAGWAAILQIKDLTEAERAELARHITAAQNVIIARQFWRAEKAKQAEGETS